jgi:1-deoxy-D-xylulose-5-phosphate reductoisomerase
VVIHPQSIVQSMVEFTDGSTMAQCSPPDMRLPIALGLAWPDRVPAAIGGLDWSSAGRWDFLPLDDEAFPAVALARRCGAAGSTYPAAYNAANEVCVEGFLSGRIRFTHIVDTVARVIDDLRAPSGKLTVDDVLSADRWARERAQQLVPGDSPGSGDAVVTGGGKLSGSTQASRGTH